jgi:molybdate-binding protein
MRDLVRGDITCIKRQAGSGTRVFPDYELNRAWLSSDSIKGYKNEVDTRMSVAVVVCCPARRPATEWGGQVRLSIS